MALTYAEAEDIMDMIAAQQAAVAPYFGNQHPGSSASRGAYLIEGLADAVVDVDVKARLLAAAVASSGQWATDPNTYKENKALLKALSNVLDNGVDAFLTSEAEDAAPEFNAIHRTVLGAFLSAANVFSPAIGEDIGAAPLNFDMGSVIATGAAAGTFTKIKDLFELYPEPANCQIRVKTKVGAGNVGLTCTMIKEDGTTEDKNVTTAGVTVGDRYDIGTAGTDLYIGVSNIAVTGNAVAGDEFEVVTTAHSHVLLKAGPAVAYKRGRNINADRYAPSNMFIENMTIIGIANIALTCTMIKADGTTEDKLVIVIAAGAAGVQLAIGAHPADKYVGCSNIIYTPAGAAGTAGDEVRVITNRLRALPTIT